MSLYMRAKHTGEALQNKTRAVYYRLYETKAVVRKRGLYRSILWSGEQQRDFDIYWKSLLGRTISNRWHKLYQSYNGIYCQEYIPEMLYTAYIEPRLNEQRYGAVLANKLLAELLFQCDFCTVPETIACSDGKSCFDAQRRVISREQFWSLVDDAGRVVVKPAAAYGSGQGILFLDMKDGKDVQTGAGIEEIQKKLLSSEIMVQKVIDQHDDLAAICPESVNTIRISTYIAGDEVHFAPIALRCGSGKGKLDNMHAGGYGVAVDDDGQIGAVAYRIGRGNVCEKASKHPATGAVFSQCRITNIRKVIDAACSLHGRLPHIGVIAWDFSINQAGEPVVIEANLHGNGIWFPQIVHGKCFFREDTRTILNSVGLRKG